MVVKFITHLLIVLLLSSQLDDIRAAATPEPIDDVLAAQDNDYLSIVRITTPKVAPNGDPWVCQVPTALASGPPASLSAPGMPTHALPFLALFADPLYVLMSFQC
jgi:hypothetical protein